MRELADKFAWRPTTEQAAASKIQRFIEFADVADYTELTQRADTDPGWFWERAIEFLDIRFEQPYQQILDLDDGPAWPKWCVGGRMNVTESLLDKHRETEVYSNIAVSYESEDGRRRAWSYAELDRESCRLTAALRELGFGPGQAIGIYMPMCPEVVAAYFAIIRCGAVAVPLFSGFGDEAIAARLNDARATGVIVGAVNYRRGQRIDMKAVMDAALELVPSVRRTIVLLDNQPTPTQLQPDRDIAWEAAVAGQADRTDATIVAADDPLLFLYTSGTTGKPKGTVLTHCGYLSKICFDMTVCMDISAGDRMLWISDFGWVIGSNMPLVCGLVGATMVLVEGTPDYPDPGRMWRLVEQHQVTYLGVTPTTIRALKQNGTTEIEQWDLSSLRAVISSGEPWTDEAWWWCFDHVCKRSIPIFNWTGGTEIGGGILIGTFLHPLKPCSFGAAIPGMGADIFDPDGQPVAADEVGELVLKVPSIGQTRGLWRDPERYMDTYWSMYQDVWRQGDWASRDADGCWYLHGRSDDTLKLAGKRTGPAEIEGLVLATQLVSEVAAIGVPDPRAGEQLICVCVVAPGVGTTDLTATRISDAVVTGLGRAYRPARVLFAPDLPKTRNMKTMRRVIRAAVLDEDPGDLTALLNPQAVAAVARAAKSDA